jgi:hypothetical protein
MNQQTMTTHGGLPGLPRRRDARDAGGETALVGVAVATEGSEPGDAAAMLCGRLHAPVGLDRGGTGPEVIALAIAAEPRHFSAHRG